MTWRALFEWPYAKGLSAETLAWRAEAAQRSKEAQVDAEARRRAANAALKTKLIEAGAMGREVKSLSAETEAARAAAEDRTALEKQLGAAKLVMPLGDTSLVHLNECLCVMCD